METMFGDVASWTLAYNAVVAGYSFTLFAYWAARSNMVSAWYLYVMGLLLSVLVTSGFQVLARYYLVTGDHAAHDALLMSTWWAAKSWIGTAVLTCVASHATWRLKRG